MARFEFRSVRVQLIDLMVAVLLLSSTISSRSIKSDVTKITDELPRDEIDTGVSAVDDGRDVVLDEFLDIILKLSRDSAIAYEKMQADEPLGKVDNTTKGKVENNTKVDGNGTKSENGTMDAEALAALHEWRRQMAIHAYGQNVLRFTGRSEPFPKSNNTKPYPKINLPTFATVPVLTGDLDPSSGYNREAIPPNCPIKNGENLTVAFNITKPKPTAEDLVLGVVTAELKLIKIPLNVSGESKNVDDSASSKWRETFQKSNLNVSEKVIETKVEEQRTLQISVYKIRNKKANELKKLDTKMVLASYEGITTWNITKAINVWGNEAKRTLNLVISVEDDTGKKIPARKIFKMRCGDDIERPMPLDMFVTMSETSPTAWINLATEQHPAQQEAYNGAASSVNRISRQDLDRTGQPSE